MKASMSWEYEYHYYWVKYNGRVVIAEHRIDRTKSFKVYHIPCVAVAVFEGELEILQKIEDYK